MKGRIVGFKIGRELFFGKVISENENEVVVQLGQFVVSVPKVLLLTSRLPR